MKYSALLASIKSEYIIYIFLHGYKYIYFLSIHLDINCHCQTLKVERCLVISVGWLYYMNPIPSFWRIVGLPFFTFCKVLLANFKVKLTLLTKYNVMFVFFLHWADSILHISHWQILLLSSCVKAQCRSSLGIWRVDFLCFLVYIKVCTFWVNPYHISGCASVQSSISCCRILDD